MCLCLRFTLTFVACVEMLCLLFTHPPLKCYIFTHPPLKCYVFTHPFVMSHSVDLCVRQGWLCIAFMIFGCISFIGSVLDYHPDHRDAFGTNGDPDDLTTRRLAFYVYCRFLPTDTCMLVSVFLFVSWISSTNLDPTSAAVMFNKKYSNLIHIFANSIVVLQLSVPK